MRRTRGLGGIGIGILLFASCSEPAPTADPAPVEATTSTSAPAAPAARVTEDGSICVAVDDDQGDSFDVCARDLGFPGILGATFVGPDIVVAVVDPRAEIVGHRFDGATQPLPVITTDGVSGVTAIGVEFEWIEAHLDGRIHRHIRWHDENPLGDDPIPVDAGTFEVTGVDVAWEVWFTRAEEVCVVVEPSGMVPICTDRASARVASASPGILSDGLRWCDNPTHGVALAAARVDAGTAVDVDPDVDDAVADTAPLPTGDTVGYALAPFRVGATERIDVWFEIDGAPLRHAIGLPQPPPVAATYPTGCPESPPTTEAGAPTSSPPTVTYPDR